MRCYIYIKGHGSIHANKQTLEIRIIRLGFVYMDVECTEAWGGDRIIASPALIVIVDADTRQVRHATPPNQNVYANTLLISKPSGTYCAFKFEKKKENQLSTPTMTMRDQKS
jgi:hypothetical protein